MDVGKDVRAHTAAAVHGEAADPTQPWMNILDQEEAEELLDDLQRDQDAHVTDCRNMSLLALMHADNNDFVSPTAWHGPGSDVVIP